MEYSLPHSSHGPKLHLRSPGPSSFNTITNDRPPVVLKGRMLMIKTTRLLMLATAFVACLCCPVLAQTSGSISGEVRDEKQAVITSATVTLRNIQTNETRTTQTNSDGRYHFASIAVGAYEISVESSGFAKYQQS